MGLLANFKIRTKVFVALLPLAVMVIVAALYSSIEMKRIDTRYSDLLDRDVQALRNLTIARAMINRFGLFLYNEIAELDIDRMQVIDAEIDKAAADFHSAVEDAKRQSPSLAPAIEAATALFDKAISDARPVRAAALINHNDKAMNLMRESFAPELWRSRNAFDKLAEKCVHDRRAAIRRTHFADAPHDSDHLDRDRARLGHFFRHCAFHRAG